MLLTRTELTAHARKANSQTLTVATFLSRRPCASSCISRNDDRRKDGRVNGTGIQTAQTGPMFSLAPIERLGHVALNGRYSPR